MIPIAIALGMIMRILLTLMPRPTKSDMNIIGAALILLLFVVLSGVITDSQSAALPLMLSGILLVLIIIYKQKLLPKVSEGTLLFHSLLSLYLIYELMWLPTRSFIFFEQFILIVVASYTALALILCFVRIRLSKPQQTWLMVIFLINSVLIGTITYIALPYIQPNFFSYFVAGFVLLKLFSGILYLTLFMLSRTSKEVSDDKIGEYDKRGMRSRQNKVFEKNYIDSDTYFLRTIGIIFLISLLFTNSNYQIIDWITALSLIVLIGTFISKPPQPYGLHTKEDLDLRF